MKNKQIQCGQSLIEIILAVAIFLILAGGVVFVDLFNSMNVPLPPTTRALLFFAQIMKLYGWQSRE